MLSFSPSGKLVQIEYALAAVAAGAPSVGIKGIVLKLGPGTYWYLSKVVSFCMSNCHGSGVHLNFAVTSAS